MQHKLIRVLVVLAGLLAFQAHGAAYTFVGVGSFAQSGTGAALSPTIHASCADGNLMILYAAARGGAETLTVTGYTELASITLAGSLKLFGRVKQAGDAAPAVDWSGTTSANAQIACFSGNVYTDLSTINAHTPTTNNATSVGFDYPAMTITTADTLVIIAGRKNKTLTGDGITINAEAGFTELGELATAGTANISVWNFVQQTAASNIVAGGWDPAVAAYENLAWNSITVSLKTGGVPAWDTPPAVLSQTTAAYTISYNANATATNIYCGLFAKDAVTPTAAAIEAGTGARATATEATTGLDDTILLTAPESPAFPVGDIYCVLKAGATYTTVASGSLLGKLLNVPTGKQRVILTSLVATSPYTGQGVAVGDYVTIDLVTSPSSFSVTQELDGDVSYAAGGSTSRQIISSVVYDVSAPANLSFTLVFNNRTCADNQPLFASSYLYRKSVAIATLNVAALCIDPEGDAVSVVANTALPVGLSLAAGSVTGTPTTCGNTNTQFTWSDLYAATYTETAPFQIGDLIPNVADVTEAVAITNIQAVCSFVATAGGSVLHGTIAAGKVASTVPAIGVLVPYNQLVSYFLSAGPNVKLRLGLGTGLGLGVD